MKKIILTSILICAFVIVGAQNIKFKKGKVLIDEIECLNYEKNATVIDFTTNDGNQSIILKFIRTGVGVNDGLYSKVIFVEQKKSFTSRTYIFTKKLLMKRLLSDKVLVDCSIDESKIDKFIQKNDEGIEANLIHH